LNSQTIEFLGTTKVYGEKKIGPVDFDIGRGEVFGFLGPNGSGKTTCIRMLLGLAKPSAGAVKLNGLDPLADHVRALTGVGYSPELPNIQTFLTPREVMKLTGAEIGSKDGQEIDRVLEEVGIIEYADVKVGKLSKGMVQRLSVGQAMLGGPRVMVLDEPMIGLDPAGTAHLREVLRGYANGGGTILMSSHMMSEVEDLCSAIGLIHRGALVFKGTPKDMVGTMLGVQEVYLRLQGSGGRVVEAVREVKGVIEVKEEDGGLRVTVERGLEARPEIAKAVVEAGAGLLSMSEGERMLERAYIEALRSDRAKA
jgi:ABC-2 type transport system ATP-binding protein